MGLAVDSPYTVGASFWFVNKKIPYVGPVNGKIHCGCPERRIQSRMSFPVASLYAASPRSASLPLEAKDLSESPPSLVAEQSDPERTGMREHSLEMVCSSKNLALGGASWSMGHVRLPAKSAGLE